MASVARIQCRKWCGLWEHCSWSATSSCAIQQKEKVSIGCMTIHNVHYCRRYISWCQSLYSLRFMPILV